MFARVRLLKGWTQPLWYKIPDVWTVTIAHGSIVHVPLRNRTLPAVVVDVHETKPADITFAIKEMLKLEEFPLDPHYHLFLERLARFYFTDPFHFYQRVKAFLSGKVKPDEDDIELFELKDDPDPVKARTLTDAQQAVVDYVAPHITTPSFKPTLVYGVTGCGKTEIYKNLMLHALRQNKSVILLLPEVSLSLQFFNLLTKQMPDGTPLYSFHSLTKQSEKKQLWDRLLKGLPVIIIGVHLPVLLPVAQLGLIIVDEEHEQGFQEKKHPKINSKEVALWRAQQYGIPIVLGSATPSITSLYNVKQNGWKLFRLTQRFAGAFPVVKHILLTDKKKRSSFWVSKPLQLAIADRLEKKEQTLIYINRRGFSFFMQCKSCGHTFSCPDCSVSLTLHKNSSGECLRCHYCGYQTGAPTTCPGVVAISQAPVAPPRNSTPPKRSGSVPPRTPAPPVAPSTPGRCGADEKQLIKKGIGTQQMVSILEELFPTARIARADLDTTSQKRLWHETVEKFSAGELDILVGTQTITKGYHFPGVTLVGVIWADLNLNFPIFNASETTLQQLLQVAGRAGRESEHSEVIVQSMADHPVFKHLNEQEYLKFYEEELEARTMANYPPLCRLVQIEVRGSDEKTVDDDSFKLTEFLMDYADKKGLQLSVLGPAKPVVHKIQKTEMRHIFIKAQSFKAVHELLAAVDFTQYTSSLYVVPTP